MIITLHNRVGRLERRHCRALAICSAAIAGLDRWAGNITEGTEDAAISGVGPQSHSASGACVKPLACVRGHRLQLALPT